jgi:hypothetical protein
VGDVGDDGVPLGEDGPDEAKSPGDSIVCGDGNSPSDVVWLESNDFASSGSMRSGGRRSFSISDFRLW